VKEIQTRLGRFCVISIENVILLTPCDTRMKIIRALANRDLTADEMAKSTGTAYSTVMDHMDVLEKAGIVASFLKRDGGKRRIYFGLNVPPRRPAEIVA